MNTSDCASDARSQIERLLGKPWRVGAKGPDAYDCWGLVQHVERELAGRDLCDASDPPTNVKQLARYVANHPAMRQWREVERPVHLGPVLLAHINHPFHVGVYLDIDGGVLLHCQFGTGVTVDSLLALRHAGWRRMIFYDWAR
jgi:cell wall-associated NlpC family hydrolase